MVLRTGPGLAWLARADAVAALGVAGIAALVSVRLGRKSVEDLLDAAPSGLLERIARAASAVDEVDGVSQVRVRRSGPKTFADVILQVPRGLPVERAHEIAHAAEDAIRGAVLDVDVMVHTEPAEGEPAASPATGAAARSEERLAPAQVLWFSTEVRLRSSRGPSSSSRLSSSDGGKERVRHQLRPGPLEQRLPRPGHPAGDGGLVHLVHRADLVEAQPLQEVEAEDVPLLGLERRERLAERAPELGPVAPPEQLERPVHGGSGRLEQRDLGQRLRSAPRVAAGVERQAERAGPEPVLQRAATGVLEDPRRPALLRHQHPGPQPLEDLVDEGRRGVHAPDRAAHRGEQLSEGAQRATSSRSAQPKAR